MSNACPVCDSPIESYSSGRDATAYSCPHCGNFTLTNSLVASLPQLRATDSEASAKLSYAIRRAQESPKAVLVSTYTAQAFLSTHYRVRVNKQTCSFAG